MLRHRFGARVCALSDGTLGWPWGLPGGRWLRHGLVPFWIGEEAKAKRRFDLHESVVRVNKMTVEGFGLK